MRRWIALAALLGACGGKASPPPPFERPAAAITIRVAWPGHTPADLLTSIAAPIEEAVGADPDAEHLTTRARDGAVVIELLLRDGADPGAVAGRVRGGSSRWLRALPADAQVPAIEWRPAAIRMRALVDGPVDPVALRSVAEHALRPQIEAADGVRGVTVCGGARAQVAIEVDPVKLATYAVGLGDVDAALAAAHVGGPAVAGTAPATDPDAGSLAALVIAMRNGATVRLSDVARVTTAPAAEPCSPPAPPDRVELDVLIGGDDEVAAAVADRLRGAAARAQVRAELGHGPVPYAIAIRGDAAAVARPAAAVRGALAGATGVDLEPPASTATVWTIDRAAADDDGVDPRAAARAVAAMSGPVDVGAVRDVGDAWPVVLSLTDRDPSQVLVPGRDGTSIPLGALARRELVDGAADELDRRPAVIVRFTVPGGGDPDRAAADAIARAEGAAKAPAGVTITAWREP